MWKRFTNAARLVVFYAQEEARRLNIKYVDSEHLLFGIISVGDDSMAAAVLLSLGLTLNSIRSALESRVNIQETIPFADYELSEDAKLVIEMTRQEVMGLKHNYVSTAHLLLGLIRDMDGQGGKILRGLGLELESVRAAYVQQIQETGEREKIETPLLDRHGILAGFQKLWMKWRSKT